MRKRIKRTLWGIQHKSFQDNISYLQRKHLQKKNKLNNYLDLTNKDINIVRQKISYILSSTDQPSQVSEVLETYDDLSLIQIDDTLFTQQVMFNMNFKKRPLGLIKKKVLAYIKKLKEAQEMDLLQLTEELKSAIEERDILLQELSACRDISCTTKETASTFAHGEISFTQEEMKQTDSYPAPTEEWKKQIEDAMRERLLIEVKSDLRENLIQGKSDDWAIEIREDIKKKLQQEQVGWTVEDQSGEKRGKSRSKVVPIQYKTASKVMPPINTLCLAVSGTDFWDEDIEPLLFQSAQWKQQEFREYLNNSESAHEYTESSESSHMRESKQSPAIAEEAYSLRIKYIVGKIAGTDLKDNSGNIIIRRNSLITEEVMNWATKEGKLAELIVNMNVLGLGE